MVSSNLNDNFWKWFGNSIVTTPDGQPRVVYHGTANDFQAFEPKQSLRNLGMAGMNAPVRSEAYFFTPSRDLAWVFADNRSDTPGQGRYGKVMSVYLRLERPFDLTKKSSKVITLLKAVGIDPFKHYGLKNGTDRWATWQGWKHELSAIQTGGRRNHPDYSQEQVQEIADRLGEEMKRYLTLSNLEIGARDLWDLLDKPQVVQYLKKAGYDGALINERDAAGRDKEGAVSFAVFSPEQIKSVSNQGTWNNENPNLSEGLTKKEESMDDNLQVRALSQQLQGNPQGGKRVNPATVQDAWKLSKDMAQQTGVQSTDPQYWDKVMAQTKQSLGIFPDENQQPPKTGEGSNFGFKPAPPAVQAPGPNDTPKPVFEYTEPKDRRGTMKPSKEEPQYAGQSKEELAKDMIKKLRKDGRSDNEITNSLVNRMLFDFKTASDLVGLKDGPVEPKDPYANGQLPKKEESWGHHYKKQWDSRKPRENDENDPEYIPPRPAKKKVPTKPAEPAKPEPKMKETLFSAKELRARGREYLNSLSPEERKEIDRKWRNRAREASAYDKGGILFQPGNPVEPTGTRDPFEWELSSTKYLAKALILLKQRQFEVRFEVLSTQTMKWPMEWRFLKPHGIVSALRITVNQLTANPNGMTASSISNAIDPGYTDDLVKTMGKLFKSYVKIWKKSNYQIVVFSTDNGRNLPFVTKLGKELAKNSGMTLDAGLQAEFCDPYVNISKTKGYYIVIKNSAGGGFKEDVLRDETTSAAFSATPENAAAWKPGKTGPEINSDASSHLDQMRKKGFGAQLEGVDKGKKASYTEAMENPIKTQEDLTAKKEELYTQGFRRQSSFGVGVVPYPRPEDDQQLRREAEQQRARLEQDGEYEAIVLTVPSHLTQGFRALSGNHYPSDYPTYEVWYRPGKFYKKWKNEDPVENPRDYSRIVRHNA